MALLFSSACNSPQAVASFAESAQKALAGGPPIFNDLYNSCIRRQGLRPSADMPRLFAPLGSKGAPGKEPAGASTCARFATQGESLVKVSGALSDYFHALQQLAAFNASGVSGGSESAAENAATAAGLSYTQVTSAGKLASLVTRAFTEGYQRRRIFDYLRNADPAVADITQGLDLVTKTYLDFLQEEQQTTTARYQSVGDGTRDAVLFLLNRSYSGDMAEINRRRGAATALRDALKDIREGHHQLLANARHLSAKQLSVALEPYTSKLDGLLPALQNNR